MFSRRRRFAVAAAALTLVAAAGPALRGTAAAQPPADLLIRNVRIAHGDGRVSPLATVVVRAGIIDLIQYALTPAGLAAQPPARVVLDGSGRTLVPGLIDVRARMTSQSGPIFLSHGVTTVRGVPDGPALPASALAEPTEAGLRVVPAGPEIDGPGGDPGTSIVVSTVGETRAAVRRLAESGARIVSAAPHVDPVLMSVLVPEARARGLTVSATLGRTTAAQAAALGVSSIECLSGIVAPVSQDAPGREWRLVPLQRLEAVAAALARDGVVLVPTLAAHEAAGAANDELRQALPFMQAFVGFFVRAGGRIAAGSDAGRPTVAAGAGLHRELELLVNSGLSPAQALRAATADAAALLGLGDGVGTIDVGKAADFVLVDGDPLADIRFAGRIAAVVKDGVIVRQR